MFNFLKAISAGKINTSTAMERINARQLTLIDVRDPSEVLRTGIASAALHIPMGSLEELANPARKSCHQALCFDTPVALYCASGARSGIAAQTLRNMGYKEVHNFGSLTDWQRAGGALSTRKL
ncbi:rhodanese-like domain-containing protein [Halocynthiibacter namhaensis]|uniref:rhodanese-like domain-containing protein n=1 Tax=Halocynthiibacter namhaensis TaxID=1290553 RepID=UPI0005795EAA|nr:rhodanese-like domain-containing protein [Halocynthiibacter namhaensis]